MQPSLEKIQAYAIAAERELYRRDILDSTLLAARIFYRQQAKRDFIVADFHRKITNALDRVIAGTCKRLIINVAPRYSKTELAVKTFIAKGLAHNPAAKFIHTSYSDTLALDNSETVRDIVSSDFYQQLFPKVKIKKGSDAKQKWYTTAGGGVYATGTGGQLTGFGAGVLDEDEDDDHYSRSIEELLVIMDTEDPSIFGGAIIIDDPIKPEDADSDLIRERINMRFDSTIRNRVNSRNTPIVITMQRLHPLDLTGYLIEQDPGEWEVLSFPVITEAGEALWPLKHTLPELLAWKAQNEVVFGRQGMQDPKPAKGLLFPENELRYFSPPLIADLEGGFTFMAVDPADEGADDLSAPVAELHDNAIFITDVIYTTDGTDITLPRIVDLARTKRPTQINIEGVSGWIQFGKNIRTAIDEINPDITVRIIKENRNKKARILAQAAFIKRNFRFLEEKCWTPEYRKFMKVLTSYMKEGTSKHDDAPDSLVIVAEFFDKTFNELWR